MPAEKKKFANFAAIHACFPGGPGSAPPRLSPPPSLDGRRAELDGQTAGRLTVEPELSSTDLATVPHRLKARLDDIVMPAACGLPQIPMPEDGHVTTMRYDMVDDLDRPQFAHSLASKTKRMLALMRSGRLLPSGSIATSTGRTAPMVILLH